jgi:predicted transcriptional regulator
MKELTKAEEQIMQYLWKLEKAFMKDIVEQFPEPRPAYTTVSTVVRVLVKKGVIGYDTFGKVNQYYPLITKRGYFKNHFKGMLGSFFNGSTTKFASWFTESKQFDLSELEEIKQLVEEKIEEIKKESDRN